MLRKWQLLSGVLFIWMVKFPHSLQNWKLVIFMEHLSRYMKAHRLQAKQEEKDLEEEQPLLYHQLHDNFHMAQSLDSQDKARVDIKIDSKNNGGKETDNASKFHAGSSSSKVPSASLKPKVSFEEVLSEAVRRRDKDSPEQESSRVERVLRSRSKYFSQRNSWRSLMDKTKSRLIDAPEEQYEPREESEHEDSVEDIPEEYKSMNFNAITIIQWASLVSNITALVCSLSIPVIKRQTLWDLPLWKWELFVLALICGRLACGFVIRIVVIFIERNFLLRKRVLYFVYGMRKAVENCLWLGLVLLAWYCILNDQVEKETKSKVLPFVSKILLCFLLGTVMWLLKTLLVKFLALSFHVNNFFERIQAALFSQYVIETLSGPPLFERRNSEIGEVPVVKVQNIQNAGANMPGDLRETLLHKSGNQKLQRCSTIREKCQLSRTMSKKERKEISIDDLHKLNQKNISAWNMKRMIHIIRHGALSTLDEHILSSDVEDESAMAIKSESQAKEAAKKIFNKVAKQGSPYIYMEDVMLFMAKDEALKTLRLLGAACENEGISKSSLNSWLVNAFRERRALALSLDDTKTAVDELHNMLNIIVAFIIAIIWLVIFGIPITHFLVFISSQLLVAVFMFGNTCKTVFEAIIFLFVMHPFDVGDKCEVDGVTMTVEEMNILTTIFLRYDNQKITYPNSVLATKPIGNFYRSPDMVEIIEFFVHISTPMQKISTMKERIVGYVERNKQHWHQAPTVVVKDVEDMNRVKLSMRVVHRLNFQNSAERGARRGLLIEELIRIVKELGIEFRMLPLDVNVRNTPALTSIRLPSDWTAGAD